MTDCYVVKIYQKKWNYIFQTGDVALRYRNITKQRFHADRRQKPFSALQTSITTLRARTRPSGKIPHLMQKTRGDKHHRASRILQGRSAS